MRVDVSFKYLENSSIIENALDKDIQKIERRIKIFKRDDPIHMSIHVEKNPHREQYFCRVHIYLPSKLIKADEKSDKVTVVINKTFAALTKQLERVKYKVETHLGRRKPKQ